MSKINSKFLRGSISAVSKPISQENTRVEALDEIYKIYKLLHRSDLNISVNNSSDLQNDYLVL